MRSKLIATCLVGTANAQQTAWGQCGGTGWAGATTCVSGYFCNYQNDYYSQCIPGTASSTAATTSTTATVTTTTGTGTTTKVTTTTTATGAGTTTYPTTLQSGYYWIRAVESPNFHSYLQAAPTAIPSPGPGDAYLLSNTRAGQFNVVSGQLVYNPGSSTGETMYMWVENPTNKTQRTLETWFDTSKNTYGTFVFSGDTLTWSVSDISRPNTGAWYVCGDDGQLYINTGAYAYDAPSGCADETIHYYGGSTADA